VRVYVFWLKTGKENYKIKIPNTSKFFQNVAKLKYFWNCMITIKFACKKKLREDDVREMSATIRPRHFRVPIYYIKHKDYKYNDWNHNLSSYFMWA
jgi:hypothetical protein